jgi:hypothetical protein
MIGEPLIIKIGDEKVDGGVVYYYETPPMPPLSTMLNFGLDTKDQKFKRTVISECFGDLNDLGNTKIIRDEDGNALLNKEQQDFIIQERDRIIDGCWYLIKGKPIYFTGDNYFYLNYWWIGAENEDGYPDFRYADCKYFYFADIVDKNPDVFGGLFVTGRRFGKTEKELCRVYRKSITTQNKIFALMSLTKDEAKENLFAKIVRSWDVMFEFFKPKHSGTSRPTESLIFAKPPVSSKKSKEKQKEQVFLNNRIGTRATKIAALQGKKPFYTFLDEGATIDEMDLTKFWSTSKQALALGGGKKIIGKVMMPCTLEEMNPKSGERYYTLWKQSNINQLTLNGRTSSGLVRYLKPYWEGLEGFIDEWGFDLKDEAIKFVENEYQSFLDKGELDEAVRYRRQFPRNANDAFNIETGTGIEEDCKMILQDVLEKANDGLFPERPCEIYEVDGEIRTRSVKPTKDCLYIIEEPEENTEYVIGIDGTATDKASSGTDPKNKKSDFAIVVTKKLKVGERSYCEVAYISRIPVNKDDMFRIAYYLYRYYNIFGNCKVSPEANAGNISPIFSYFTNRGAKRALIQEPKYVGTDSKEVLSRYGFVRTGKMKEAQIYLLNIQIRLFGHHFRSKRLIENILKTGVENTDLSDAFQAALVGWGNFGNIEHKEAVNNNRYQQLRTNRVFNQNTGRWDKVEIKQSA